MGLDGFSMGNLGINADLTSAQMANQAEQIARKESEIKIKDVTESAEDEGVKRKKEQSEQDNFNDGFKKNEEESEEQQEENKSSFKQIDFENKNPKEFSIRINPKTDMVELFNNKEEKILETMSAQDLMELVSKLDSASGVLVNRKI